MGGVIEDTDTLLRDLLEESDGEEIEHMSFVVMMETPETPTPRRVHDLRVCMIGGSYQGYGMADD